MSESQRFNPENAPPIVAIDGKVGIPSSELPLPSPAEARITESDVITQREQQRKTEENREKSRQALRGGLRLGISFGTVSSLGMKFLQEQGLKLSYEDLQKIQERFQQELSQQQIDDEQLARCKTDEMLLNTTTEQIMTTLQDILDTPVIDTAIDEEKPIARAA